MLAGWGSAPGSGQRAEILGCTQGLRHAFEMCKLGTAGAGEEICRLAGAGIVEPVNAQLTKPSGGFSSGAGAGIRLDA